MMKMMLCMAAALMSAGVSAAEPPAKAQYTLTGTLTRQGANMETDRRETCFMPDAASVKRLPVRIESLCFVNGDAAAKAVGLPVKLGKEFCVSGEGKVTITQFKPKGTPFPTATFLSGSRVKPGPQEECAI